MRRITYQIHLVDGKGEHRHAADEAPSRPSALFEPVHGRDGGERYRVLLAASSLC
ncbi:MAG: hypothetical protein AB1486_16775 [Planctomycetota bacterium]